MRTSETWPNFFIVGAPKAATTSLYEYLSKVPGIFMASRKEPHYFSQAQEFPGWSPARPIRDTRQYLRLFKNAGNAAAIGEASTSYLAVPETAEKIYAQVPNARIIITLRDPVERLYSAYWMHFRLGKIHSDFETYVSSLLKNNERTALLDHRLAAGLYSKPVAKYIRLFGEPNVKIVFFEELVRQPGLILQEVTSFLGVAAIPKTGQVYDRYNRFGLARGPVAQWIMRGNVFVDFMQRHTPARTKSFIRNRVLVKKAEKPPMPEDAKNRLRDFYAQDQASLETLLNKTLPWSYPNTPI